MIDGLQNWLQNPRPHGQSQAPAAPPTPAQAPNGKQLADALRKNLHLDRFTPDMGGLGGVIGKFASPFLSFLEQAQFSNNGRNMTDAQRQELRARMSAQRESRRDQPQPENPHLSQIFGGFSNMFGNRGE